MTATTTPHPLYQHPIGLREGNIPPHLLPRARKWYAAQIASLQTKHGKNWPDVHEWLDDYLQAELQEYIAAETNHAI